MTDAIVTQANTVYRDYATDGVPSSGPNAPAKSDIRALWSALAGILDGLSGGGTGSGYVGFTTLALLNANLNFPANTVGEVLADSTGSNNGIYLKSGASGSGSWTQVSTLTLSGLNAAIAAETTARSNADTSEATTRANADTTLTNNLATEVSRAQTAEGAINAVLSPLLTDVGAYDDAISQAFPARHAPSYSYKGLTTVTAGSFVTGVTYTIATVGSTNFTAIGASANTVGVSFVASGAGSGTGTATTIDGTTGYAALNQNDVHMCIPVMGQSLALGAVDTGSLISTAPLSTSFGGRAFMPSTGARFAPVQRFGQLVSLYEAYNGNIGETICSAMINTILTNLDAALSGNKPTFSSFVSAVGSTDYWQLKRGSVPWLQALDAVQDIVRFCRAEGVRPVVPAFVWIHGENATATTQQNQYLANLLQLQRQFEEDVRALTGQTERVIMFIHQVNRVYSPLTFQQIQQAQILAGMTDNIRLCGPIYPYAMSPVAGNYPHKSNIGENMMGQMIGRAVAAELFGQGWAPLQPLRLYMTSSTVIRIEYQVPVPPLVIDTTGLVNPASLPTGNVNGYDVQDATLARLTISSVAVSSPEYYAPLTLGFPSTGVDITLSSAPSNFPLLVSYAMRRNSWLSNGGNDSTSYDGPVTGARGCLRDSAGYSLLNSGALGVSTDNNWAVQHQNHVYA